MERYAAYKDSGIDWIGEIPVGWEVKRLKYLVSINDESLPESTEGNLQIQYVDISNVKSGTGILSTEELSFSEAPSRARRIVRDGDVIVSTVRTYLKSIAKIDNPPENLIVSTGFAVIRPRIMNPSYIGYVFYSENMIGEIISRSTGVSYPAINASEFGDIFTPIPITEEQTTITNYLDRKTAEIDALITQKQHLIELYQEEKTAIINQAVTQGIDPNAKLKDSGIDWLGEIPEGWEVKKLKYLVNILSGYSPEQCKPASIGKIEYIKVDHVNSANFEIRESEEFVENNFIAAKNNTIIFPKRGAAIGLNKVGIVNKPISFDTNLMALEIKSQLLQINYLAYLLKNYSLISIADTSTIPQINNKHIAPFEMPLPPDGEQSAIVQYIETETARIDAKIAKTKRIIELQKEYRNSLISEVVTGKIKVSQLADKEMAL